MRPTAVRRICGPLFSGPANTAVSLVLLPLLAWVGWQVLRWAVLDAQWHADAEACRALGHGGACWGVVAEKGRLILFGRYPFDAQWRPLAALLMILAAILGSAAGKGRRLILLWGVSLPVAWWLMAGGIGGLAPVSTERWGGLPLTLVLALGGIGLALPLALALAFGRRSALPLLRTLSGAYVELIRALPLVSVLFLAAFLIPLAMPEGRSPDKLLRVVVGIALFAAAYLAEAIRGGLAAVPRGQWEAAAALGMGEWAIRRHIILPQAIKVALPSLINSFIGALKETSLVTVVSLYELTGSLSLALGGDPDWRPFFLEGYLFVGGIYWLMCFALSRYSLSLERKFAGR